MPAAAMEALGETRVDALTDLSQRIGAIRSMTENVSTVELLLMPMKRRQAVRWQELAAENDETWVFVEGPDGTVHALDEPSEAGRRDVPGSVIYPELHTRLVSWWLVHAWRCVDLLEDTIENLWRWRISSGAVTGRAAVEEAGAVLVEAQKIAGAWSVAKASAADAVKRPESVHAQLTAVLLHAGMGSRMAISHERLQATNVLTLVNKVAKASGTPSVTEWYDWLSDAAHPAFGARIAFASPPMVHSSRAMTVRYYARAPLVLEGGGKREVLEPTIAVIVADAAIVAGRIMCDVLDGALAIVDDFGLTTAAATLTERTYWRNFAPVRGGRACPCGRGKWSHCGHRWGEPAPVIEISQ